MRVLLLVESACAGVGRHVIDVADGLCRCGHSIDLIYNSARSDAMFRLRFAAVRARLGGWLAIPMQHYPHPQDTVLITHLRRYVRENGPFEIIHCHSTKAGFLGRLGLNDLAQAIVYTPHAPLTMSPALSAPVRWAASTLEVGLSRLTDAIIAVSQEESNHLTALGIRDQKVFVVPNGVPTAAKPYMARTAARNRLGAGHNEIVIGCVGRLEKQKRVDLVLHAVARLPEGIRSRMCVPIIGSGSLERDLHSLAVALGVTNRVVWVGEVADATILMAGFDGYILASDYEAMPYTLLEAMAAGLPAIATRVGGVEALITDWRNGFVVERADISGLCRCLGLLAERPALRSRMSREALNVARRFSVERMIAQTLEVYSQVLSSIAPAQSVVAMGTKGLVGSPTRHAKEPTL